MTRARILVAEDDAAIRMGVSDALWHKGMDVVEAGDGETALDHAIAGGVDLLLLDLVMPKRDGLSVLAELRKAQPTLPVIVLTARGQEADRVRGLELGADDYVVKPFSIRELLARVEAVLRRSPQRPSDVSRVKLHEGFVDLNRQEACFDDGSSVSLSDREVQLLQYLARHAGRIVKREELLSHVWGIPLSGGETRTVDVHVARLRQKLRDQSSDAQVLRTVHGKGYTLAQPGSAAQVVDEAGS